jgi:hypothetical protein
MVGRGMKAPIRLFRTGIVMLLCWGVSPAQESEHDWGKTALVASNLPAGLALIHELSLHRFEGMAPRAPHWRPRSIRDASRDFDVAGNALYCYVITRTLRHGYEYAGFSPFSATLLAGTNMLLLHTYIKYRESLYWGAQPHDFLGAWGGVSFAVLQSGFPALERVQYKWFWYDNRRESGFVYSFLEEYRAQRFFVSVRLGDLLFTPRVLHGLGVAFGGGLRGDGRVRNYLGLDYDLRVLLPNFLGEALNYLHLPLPAVYYDNGFRFGLSL